MGTAKPDTPQAKRFRDAARESGADMTKDEFARVIGGLAKPQAPAQEADEDQPDEESA